MLARSDIEHLSSEGAEFVHLVRPIGSKRGAIVAQMVLQRARDHLLPKHERDPQFREYLTRLSASGLQTLGIVVIAAALLLHVGRLAAGAARRPRTAPLAPPPLPTLPFS